MPLCCLPQHINPLSHSCIDLGNFYKEPNLNTFTLVLDSVERIWEEDRLAKMTIPTSWCCAGVSPGCCGEWGVPNLSWKDVQKGSVHLNDPGETFLKCNPTTAFPCLKINTQCPSLSIRSKFLGPDIQGLSSFTTLPKDSSLTFPWSLPLSTLQKYYIYHFLNSSGPFQRGSLCQKAGGE